MNKTRALVSPRLLVAAAAVFLAMAAAAWWLMQSSVTAAPVAGIHNEQLQQLAATDRDIKVFKTPSCGCCGAWVEHLEASGFDVEAVNVSQSELNAIKQAAGLDPDLASCHTAFIEGYLVEGHVPASDIRRLVDERPTVAGISVPGMPIGSPGMEMGDRFDPYDVVAFGADGETSVFNRHNQD
ncbi:hypothetical protein J2T57_003764 [Natronocella acetinitrilica]|jgi:hypothetical protein|uniref:DUF411 domain-containing protein n=1 Tax=Natronocella acetinitrilica TaxID=414046 RepID=A0AAE3KDQ9_9GAMM|nr:DUF411 domain-containing protein [Natronocella acetinitrilica]MCP1676593.1 hypothetical protein [Natronocella acetinitrilica]